MQGKGTKSKCEEERKKERNEGKKKGREREKKEIFKLDYSKER